MASAPRADAPPNWSAEEAERWLLSLELFGMHFGLERMQRLMADLGSPNEAFRTIHVVGTNGKSSTVRMIAALLAGHSVRTGAYLSPHLVSFSERIRVEGADSRRGVRCRRGARAGGAEISTAGSARRPRDAVRALTAAAYSQLAERASRSPSSRPASAGAGTRRTSSARRSSC